MTVITIFNRDEDTVIQGSAVQDDGTAYDQADISTIEILRTGPHNDTTTYAAVTATFTTGNAFEGTISSALLKEGWWGFQFKFTLASNSKPIYSKIYYRYVGPTITPS